MNLITLGRALRIGQVVIGSVLLVMEVTNIVRSINQHRIGE